MKTADSEEMIVGNSYYVITREYLWLYGAPITHTKYANYFDNILFKSKTQAIFYLLKEFNTLIAEEKFEYFCQFNKHSVFTVFKEYRDILCGLVED